MTTLRTKPSPTRLSERVGPAHGAVPFGLADGTVLAVHDHGPARADATAVLVHGWTQDHTSWEDVTARLASRGVRVLAYDARGHGWSDAGPTGTATIEQLADDLAELVEQLVPDGRMVLAGHSLGGPVIMCFAERHAELLRRRVAGVAFVATSAGGLGRDLFGLSARFTAPALLLEPFVTRVRAWSRARRNLRRTGWLAEVLRLGLYGPGAATAHNRRRTAAQVGRSHPATTAALIGELVRHDRVHVLAGLGEIPVVVLAGTKDGLCPMPHARAMAAAMPHSEFVVFPKAGHMLPYERPGEVAQHIARLLDGKQDSGR